MKTPMLLAALAAASVVVAQTKPAAKPTQKPKPAAQTPTARPLLGTAQLPGDDGKLNQAYTMGTRGKLNFTLTGVRYTKVRWNVEGNSTAPGREEKLMILSFSIQNPNPEITPYHSGSLKFTAIDQENENHEWVGNVVQKASDKSLNINLKPAQKVECEAAIVVPGKGVVPKLMVAHQSGGDVLRYDLRPIVQKLEKPWSENGDDVLETIAGEKDTYYPLLQWDVKYQTVAIDEKRFGNWTIGDEHVFVLARVGIKKMSKSGHIARFRAELVSEDGDKYPDSGLKKASLPEGHPSTGDYGQEMNARMAFSVPKGIKIAKMRLWEEQGNKSVVVEWPMDIYATMDGKPIGGAKPETAPSTGAAQTGVPANEYTTIFRKTDGATAMEVAHVERKEGPAKTTEIAIAGKRALLLEEAEATTLYLPDTNETLRAPKAKDREPVTSLSYYAMAYANATAPKPKKKNPFGDIAKAVLSQGASSLGSSIMSSDSLSNFGKVAVGRVVEDAAQRSLTYQLGRAVMTSTESLGDGRTTGSVTVDKKVYAETTFKAAKTIDPATMKIDPAAAKSVDAKELYKRFADFMGQGLK